jgi:hypothetical protein
VEPRTAETLTYALTAPLGLYQQADTIVRLLTAENVAEVMSCLPHQVRANFVQFAREAYVPRGPRFAVAGSVVPESCLDALRTWLEPERRRYLPLGTSPLPLESSDARFAAY